MNEMAFHIRHQVEAQPRSSTDEPRVINRRLRRTLHNRGGGCQSEPLDFVGRWIESRGGA
jgi:hypothetical protein